MNIRTLGLTGMLCSPFLAIDLFSSGTFQNYQPSAMSGLFSFIYMTGWMCSILGLFRFHAAGVRPWVKTVFIIQLLFLTLGEIWNVYSILKPMETSLLFRILDLFWPVSNCFMFVTGIAVMRAKRIAGWKRYIPFVVGLWFPVCLVLIRLLFGSSQVSLYVTTLYSATAWLLLGYVVYSATSKKVKINLEEAIPTLRATA